MSALGILALILAHMADYVTFMFMVGRRGIGEELNPIVVRIAEEQGLALLTVAKFATVLLVAAVFLISVKDRPRLASGVLAFGVFIGALGAFSNILTIA